MLFYIDSYRFMFGYTNLRYTVVIFCVSVYFMYPMYCFDFLNLNFVICLLIYYDIL